MKIDELKGRLKSLDDPRRTNRGNYRHKLEDIIIIGLCSIICGGEDFVDMEDFGKEREDFLRQFLELPNGIPDSDTFRRMFEKLDPEGLSECLVNWLEVELPERCIIAVDGKTIKGSKSKEHKAYHVVSAFVSDNHITLGEVTVNEKSNEITAVPELLDMLYLDNAIITADAMSCQKTIVEKIISENADYVIGLKNNQRSLYEFAEKCFENLHPDYPMIEFNERYHCFETTRRYYLSDEIENTPKRKMWRGLRRIGLVVSEHLINGQVECEMRYFITSLTDLKEFANSVRKHWSVENNLHWSLDVIFREDASRSKKDNSPLNLNVLRKMAITLLAKARTGRLGKRKMMFKAALNPDVLLSILLAYS